MKNIEPVGRSASPRHFQTKQLLYEPLYTILNYAYYSLYLLPGEEVVVAMTGTPMPSSILRWDGKITVVYLEEYLRVDKMFTSQG